MQNDKHGQRPAGDGAAGAHLPIRDNQACNLPNIEAGDRRETSGVKGARCQGCGSALVEVGPVLLHEGVQHRACPTAAGVRVEGVWCMDVGALLARLEWVQRETERDERDARGAADGGAPGRGGRGAAHGRGRAGMVGAAAGVAPGGAAPVGSVAGGVRAAASADGETSAPVTRAGVCADCGAKRAAFGMDPSDGDCPHGAPVRVRVVRPGVVVEYEHPDWGPSRGRVLDAGECRGAVLVQDLSVSGAREWWPVAGLRVLDDGR